MGLSPLAPSGRKRARELLVTPNLPVDRHREMVPSHATLRIMTRGKRSPKQVPSSLMEGCTGNTRKLRRSRFGPLLMVLAAVVMAVGQAASAAQAFTTETGTLWGPVLEWEVENPAYSGNPFDVIADVAFTHVESGQSHETQMFYASDDLWKFRFTGTRTGEWTFETVSDDADLDGLKGTVVIEENPDADVRGFLVSDGNQFAIQSGDDGAVSATLYNVYYNHPDDTHQLHHYSLDREETRRQINVVLDELESHGLQATFIEPRHSWFSYGAESHRDHDSVDPDPESFRILETIIMEAHKRGLHVHIWKWGDEERRWTPHGVGGINGEADRRLQRYIASRLGPLPGWTMSYGFDLQEWVEPDEVRDWHAYMHDHLGWPRLLMAREEIGSPPTDFFTPGEMDVFSNDERFIDNQDFYDQALRDLGEEPSRPVLYERRFHHTRDDIWDMDHTRRALWQFTLAGGAGAIWGVLWADAEDAEPYPNPEQLLTHREFWRDRFLLGMERANDLSDGYVLREPESDSYVFYKEGTSAIELDLSGMDRPLPAIAVDTKRRYEEIKVGELNAEAQVWTAPYESDWALAVGSFEEPE